MGSLTLRSSGWPQILNPPTLAFQEQGVQVCTATPNLIPDTLCQRKLHHEEDKYLILPLGVY